MILLAFLDTHICLYAIANNDMCDIVQKKGFGKHTMDVY